MLIYPNCKINLGLKILNKRPDNFHNIETVFYPVNLCDILEIHKSDKTSFQTSGITIEGTEENICLKAYQLLSDFYNLPPVKIHLHKSIPIGAGLGGGSSDGAFTIKLLSKMFALDLKYEKMSNFTKKLGSDCSFFLNNKPTFAKDKGDIFEEINLNLKNYYILIIKPDFNIITKEAYELFSSKSKGLNTTSIKDVIFRPIDSWKGNLVNDFENIISEKYPEINNIKSKLYSSGAIYASMSGSGSVVYGIFKNSPDESFFSDYKFVWKGILN